MRKQNRSHLLPFVSLFLVVVFIVLVVESDIQIDHTAVSVAVILYLISNLAYGYKKKQLSVGRILEFGAVALLIELIAFRYLI